MIREIKENKPMILLLLTGAVYFFLKYIVPLTAPVLMAMLFVTILGPFLQKMESKLKVHRQVGAVLLLVLASAIIGILMWVLFSWIVGSLPVWVQSLDDLENKLALAVHQICGTIGKAIKIDEAYLEEIIFFNVREGIDWFQLKFVPGILSQSLEYIKVIASFGAVLVIFVIGTVLLAKDYDMIMNRMLNRTECHFFLEIVCGIIRYTATYVKAQVIIMCSIGILAAVVLSFNGVEQGALWGLLAGILDALPFIGTGIILVPLAVSQLFTGNYVSAVFCLLLYVVCIFIREFLEPKLIGEKVGVPPIAILVSIYAGVKLFGIWGIVEGPLGFIIIYQAYIGYISRMRNLRKLD